MTDPTDRIMRALAEMDREAWELHTLGQSQASDRLWSWCTRLNTALIGADDEEEFV